MYRHYTMLAVILGCIIAAPEDLTAITYIDYDCVIRDDLYHIAIVSDAVVDMYGGSILSDFGVFDESTFNLFNGYISDLYAKDSSTVNIFGGTVQRGYAEYSSVVHIYGGQITGSIGAGMDATIFLHAYDVQYVPGSIMTPEGIVYGQLRGYYLLDSEPFSINMLHPDSYSLLEPHLRIVPEPASLFMLLFGGLVFFRSKRRS